ncbi:MAG TPA: type IV-A pilus assembly ATPase PilB, partial [Rubrivivax sp.]|nr:type IV-A pilus assembly ATPase PilB [Rubrivivax sp.]
MAADPTTETPANALSGVARVLVNAGRISTKSAEDLLKSARDRRTSFSSAAVAAGAVSAADLAHTLSQALALPLLDLNAIDLQKVPKNILDAKTATQYQLLVLGKRGSRLIVATADPTHQEAAERVKFATQLSPEWVIVEQDKLAKLIEAQGVSAAEQLEAIASSEFDFDVTEDEGPQSESQDIASEVEDAPVVRFLQKMLIDAINMRASDLHFEPYEYTYR